VAHNVEEILNELESLLDEREEAHASELYAVKAGPSTASELPRPARFDNMNKHHNKQHRKSEEEERWARGCCYNERDSRRGAAWGRRRSTETDSECEGDNDCGEGLKCSRRGAAWGRRRSTKTCVAGARNVEEILNELESLLDEREEAHARNTQLEDANADSTDCEDNVIFGSMTCGELAALFSDDYCNYDYFIDGKCKCMCKEEEEKSAREEEERSARGCCYWSNGMSCISSTCNAHKSDSQFERGSRRGAAWGR